MSASHPTQQLSSGQPASRQNHREGNAPGKETPRVYRDRPKFDWPAFRREVLGRLDLAEEYRLLGVKFVGVTPNPEGWLECHAIDREDGDPSAGVNVRSGVYKDFAGEAMTLNFFEFAARHSNSRFADWKEAQRHYAEKVGVSLPGDGARSNPDDCLTFLGWDASEVKPWCQSKGGIGHEAIRSAGGRLAHSTWPRSADGRASTVVAMPGYAGGRADTEPSAWVIFQTNGEPLPPTKSGRGQKKILTTPGSHGGLMNEFALERLAQAEAVWKCEGVSDMLAMQSAIPADLRDIHVALTNSGGCAENPKPGWADLFRGKTVYVVHDADIPGQSGAAKWCHSLGGVAEVVNVQLPYAIAEKHGKDVRDFLADGHAYDDLLAIARATPSVRREPDPRAKSRPFIEITTERHEVLDAAIRALARIDNLYCRGSQLAMIDDELDDALKLTRRTTLAGTRGTPRILALSEPMIGCYLTQAAVFTKRKTDREGNPIDVVVHPDEWLIRAVATRQSYPGIRNLAAVAECPFPRPDGSIVTTPGYDPATETFYRPSIDFPAIPDRPTQEDAKAAWVRVARLVRDFPFKTESGEDKAVWVAGLLTAIARPAISGPVPGIAVNGNRAGTGKGLLINQVGIISQGRPVPTSNYPSDPVEAGKVKVAIALSGKSLIHFDNLDEGSTYGNSGLDSAITSTTVDDRVLGSSKMTGEIPFRVAPFLSGNNISPGKDAYRRWLVCNLSTGLERPEERGDLEIGDLSEHTMRHRGEYVRDVLTMLRAHAVAGYPRGNWSPLGSFESWDRIVRGAVWFASGIDCGATRRKAADESPARLAKIALLEGWLELPDKSGDGITTAHALELVSADPNAYPTLNNALMQYGRDGKHATTRVVGTILRGMRDCWIDGKMFVEAGTDHRAVRWKVVTDDANPLSSEEKGECTSVGECVSPQYAGVSESSSRSTQCNALGNEWERHSPTLVHSPRETGEL